MEEEAFGRPFRKEMKIRTELRFTRNGGVPEIRNNFPTSRYNLPSLDGEDQGVVKVNERREISSSPSQLSRACGGKRSDH